MKFKQFLNNYEIYKKRKFGQYNTYEKGDWKYDLFKFNICFFIAIIAFFIFCIITLQI